MEEGELYSLLPNLLMGQSPSLEVGKCALFIYSISYFRFVSLTLVEFIALYNL